MPPLAAATRELLQSFRITASVPCLWHWGMANGVILLERRSLQDRRTAVKAWQQVQTCSTLVDTAAGPAALLDDCSALARQFRLTAYDAAYLELALRLHAPLITLDRQLRAAAAQAGVAVEL